MSRRTQKELQLFFMEIFLDTDTVSCFILNRKEGVNNMNQMQTIGTVSKNLGISSRMLRYYEQIGLIGSRRVEDYAYRKFRAASGDDATLPEAFVTADTLSPAEHIAMQAAL